ncbi:MAG: hypothetical protein F6K42_02020 [Leptolyngbya sp. SIO1D8]|nr:hypothetical protein [Leptolyngbya sp. SIO1D8]
MTRSDFPDNWHDLIAGYTLGNLTPAEQAQLDELLHNHPELQQELPAYEATLAQLPQALAAQSPPANLESKILQTLHTPAAASQPLTSLPFSSNRRWRYLPGLGAAIAAGLLLMLGLDNYHLRQALTASRQELGVANQLIQQLRQNQEQSETILASLRTANAVYSLEGTGDVANASGSVVTLAAENTAILIPHNLPSLPAEEVYRFWAATETSETLVYCGQFNTQQDDPVQWLLPEQVCSTQVRQVLITVDPITASTERGGELVMQSIVSEE